MIKHEPQMSFDSKWRELLQDENLHLQKLQELISTSLTEEKLLSERLIEIESDTQISFGQKMADHIASFGGSWSFIMIFLGLMAAWIVLNIYFLGSQGFDPYPFILLNLILSCLAALQAPVIMMSQNRQEEKDRRRARGDFMINLKAEMEVRHLHQKMDLLIAEQMKSLFDLQKAQLEVLTRIERSTQ